MEMDDSRKTIIPFWASVYAPPPFKKKEAREGAE
jgi:hypothetical protein